MGLPQTSTLDFVKIFSKGIRDMFASSAGINVEVARSAMRVTGVQVAGDIGAFVAFKGDYNGIMILNFEGGAALELVAAYLTHLGLPPEDVPTTFQNDDVRNNIGEITNQIIGKNRTMVQDILDLSARANIPAVVPITIPIALQMVSKEPGEFECIRVSFTTPKRNKFYMEVAMEQLKVETLKLD